MFIVDHDELRNARISLIAAARVVIANGLSILGVSAPETM
jgi:arginyl-tRNA synthetase